MKNCIGGTLAKGYPWRGTPFDRVFAPQLSSKTSSNLGFAEAPSKCAYFLVDLVLDPPCARRHPVKRNASYRPGKSRPCSVTSVVRDPTLVIEQAHYEARCDLFHTVYQLFTCFISFQTFCLPAAGLWCGRGGLDTPPSKLAIHPEILRHRCKNVSTSKWSQIVPGLPPPRPQRQGLTKVGRCDPDPGSAGAVATRDDVIALWWATLAQQTSSVQMRQATRSICNVNLTTHRALRVSMET